MESQHNKTWVQLDMFGGAPVRFDGSDLEPHDHERLSGQILDIYRCMKDGRWRTFEEIKRITGHPEASISAQLRNLRKERFGGYTVEKQRRTEAGLWEYKLIVE